MQTPRPSAPRRPLPHPERAGTRVCIAQVGAPHGIRGEVRLRAFTQDPMAVARYGALEAEDGSATFEIEAVRPGKGVMIARLAGITGRDTAERLTNLKLYVPRERLPEPEQDTYYHADLIGLAVVGTDATELGTVAAIHNFGAGDLLEVKPPFGPNVLVPFTRAVVPVVDIVARRLVMEPPLGLFAGGHAEPARDRPESQDCSEP